MKHLLSQCGVLDNNGEDDYTSRMFFVEYWRGVRQSIETPQRQRTLLTLAGLYFLLMFTYALSNSSATTLFIEFYGAKNTPVIWTISVLCLAIAVLFYNQLLERFGGKQLLRWTAVISALLFALHFFLLWPLLHSSSGESPLFSPRLLVATYYILKEVYIILLVHLTWGYANHLFKVNRAKILYGLIGASGSLGGICGGFTTQSLTRHFGTAWVPLFVAVLTLLCFWVTMPLEEVRLRSHDQGMRHEKPLHSIRGMGWYVILICLLIGLGQVVVNVGNFKFNLIFESQIVDRELRTAYLGGLFSYINVFTLVSLVLLIPYLLQRMALRWFHLLIPAAYAAVAFLLFGPEATLWMFGTGFVLLKGIDYAWFGVGKELLYFPLEDRQKYGAKYIADMIFYRFSKGLISFGLIFLQGAMLLNLFFNSAILVWFVLIALLFREVRKQNFVMGI